MDTIKLKEACVQRKTWGEQFIVLSDLLTHFEKLKKCFLKCREFGISLNPYTPFGCEGSQNYPQEHSF
jgi:hypothetical protein